MSLKLDHIVIAVSDLDAALADYGTLGFTVIRGGEHANGVTHNVLVVFQDGAYLELIAWKRPDPSFRWSNVYHSAGEGFVDHALLPDDIEAVVKGAQSRGLDIESPVAGGRLRPDGAKLEWKTARSPGSDVPFLCGDVSPRALRVPEGDVRRHPNGVTGVASLTLAVTDVEASAERYKALLGQPGAAPVTSATIEGSPARVASLKLGNGSEVILAQPTGGEGPLAASLRDRGQGPFAVAFKAARAVGALDPELTHGARLSIVA